MESLEMKRLNPWGGYAKIKNHLSTAHKISRADMAKYMPLCQLISTKKAYDHLEDEMRYNSVVSEHIFRHFDDNKNNIV